MSECSRENGDYKSSTCIQTFSQSNLPILCKRTESNRSNGHKGVADGHCLEMNCINQNGSTKNGHNGEPLCETRYNVFWVWEEIIEISKSS